jgi:SAM-dependent methyltransferase
MIPLRIRKIIPHLPAAPMILDVGCGFKSPSITKKYIPDCVYVGVEKPGYEVDGREPNSLNDLKCIDEHILVDLGTFDGKAVLGGLPPLFHAVILSNTLEHFQYYDALEILALSARRLVRGGVIYIEVPSHRIFRKWPPSFYDGIEHRASLPLHHLVNTLLPSCEILEAGIRRDWVNILRSPITLPLSLLRGQSYHTSLTDLLGLSIYILARRNK